jgi:ACS family D-galactonate transporter-like MFS transporter
LPLSALRTVLCFSTPPTSPRGAFLVNALVVPTGGWLSQHMMKRSASSRTARGIFCGVAVCLGGLALLATPYAPNAAATITLIIAGTALPAAVFTLIPVILSEITPTSQRGAVLGINSAVGTSAGIVAPYLMGSIVEGATSAAEGYSKGFVICGVVALTGGLIGLFFLRPERELAGSAARAEMRSSRLRSIGGSRSPAALL